MRLSKEIIENFRSIEKCELNFSNYIVLVGKNNEGKTNVFRAIDMAWKRIIKEFQPLYGIRREGKFDYDRDARIVDEKTNKKTDFTKVDFKFILNEEETKVLESSIIGNTMTDGNITVSVIYNLEKKGLSLSIDEKIEVICRENGSILRNTRNIKTVLKHLYENYSINYIPSIRTENEVEDLVRRLITTNLEELISNDEYKNAIAKIHELEKNKLGRIV